MEYSLDINPRPFEAIKKGTKKIECRTPTTHNNHVPFDKLKKDDIILFTNNVTNETMKVKVLGVRHYKDALSLLESEGAARVLSSQGTVEQGVISLNSLEGYESGIKKHGLYAIEIVKL